MFQKWNLLLNELSKIHLINKKAVGTCIPRPVVETVIEKTLLVQLCLRYKVNHNLSVQYILFSTGHIISSLAFALRTESWILLKFSI